MDSFLKIRPSDSPYVKAITHWIIGNNDRNMARPDGCWDLVVFKMDGHTAILLTGQTTQAVPLHFSPGDEILTISFKASSFLSCLPAVDILNHGEILPKVGNRFQLVSDYLEIPTFENADEFVKKLDKKELLLHDEVVETSLNNHPKAYSLRSVQRHFLRTTGMSLINFRQIQRAHKAAELLQKGVSATQVAFETGYSDQPHMSRSLKYILGQTPTEIATTTIL